MPTLIELMKDPSVVVRDTTAWTVGRICELLPEAAINEVYLAPLLQCLIEGLGAEPRVASNVCWVSPAPLVSRLHGNQHYPRSCVMKRPLVTWGCGGAAGEVDSSLSPPLRPSPLWLKQLMRPQTLPRSRRSPAPTACPRPLRSSSRSSWKPPTGGRSGSPGLLLLPCWC